MYRLTETIITNAGRFDQLLWEGEDILACPEWVGTRGEFPWLIVRRIEKRCARTGVWDRVFRGSSAAPYEVVVVSRHRAAIEFTARTLADAMGPLWEWEIVTGEDGSSVIRLSDYSREYIVTPFAEVSAEEVRGRVVVGNPPLHLAAVCEMVFAIEFAGKPPRGREYTLDEMDDAIALLRGYRVTPVPDP